MVANSYIPQSIRPPEGDSYFLLAFKEEYPEAQCCFVVMGKRKETYKGFPVIPADQFLLGIRQDLPIFGGDPHNGIA